MKLDNNSIGNERISGTTKVTEIAKKVKERRLKWSGHVMRREESYGIISKRKDCRRRKCTTLLYGGACHRTPHKSGNTMKRVGHESTTRPSQFSFMYYEIN